MLILLVLSMGLTSQATEDSLVDLKIQIHGYPIRQDKAQAVQQYNPLQPENLSITTPGLTIAKLGSLGQKTSLRYNSFTAGDLAFLFDGFEISDMSDPSEGFDVSTFLMLPDFNFSISASDSSGIFSRQVGGVISVEPGADTKSFLHSAAGSFGQGLLALQKNKCTESQCLGLGVGGTYTAGQSASSNPGSANSRLENDSAGIGFLSLGWQRHLGGDRLFKLRVYSQLAKVKMDDYDQSFIFKDDPNAKMSSSNHFLGASYLTSKHQFYSEHTLTQRHMLNEIDESNDSQRDETYQVFKSKFRGSHKLLNRNKGDMDFYWYGQSVHIDTKQANGSSPIQTVNQDRIEGGVQLDRRLDFGKVTSFSSIHANMLEGFGTGGGVSQRFEGLVSGGRSLQTYAQVLFGIKERRPSFFQLFDPRFGQSNLSNEKQFYIRPKFSWAKSEGERKHNISLEYFYEKIESRVVFVWDEMAGTSSYSNTGLFTSNSFVADYLLSSDKISGRLFYRQSLDSQRVLKSLPWASARELGLGAGTQFKIKDRRFEASVDIKWLFGMYNPTGKQIGNLVQSQGSLSYQFGMNDKVSLQLNNIFNDKKIWDEGFQRQPFSWMLSLTKTI